MHDDPVAAVAAALAAKDIEAFVACYAPDATIEDADGVVLADGHDGMRARYGPMFEQFPELRFEPLARIDTERFVAQEELVTGRGDTPQRSIVLYELAGGLVVRERIFRS